MNFTKKEIIEALNWYNTKSESKAIEKTLIEYYNRYLPYVINIDGDPYAICKELYNSETIYNVSEGTEFDNDVRYRNKYYHVNITSFIDTDMGGCDSDHYIYQINVTQIN